MLLGGISIKVIKLMMAILALGLFLVASGSARDAYSSSSPVSTYEGTTSGHHNDDHNWKHNDHDWLSPGGSHFGYPTTYYYDWYYTTPTYTYTYYPTYYYPTYYYTTPVYPPVVYHDWDLDPWWGYGFGGNYYYTSSSHWTYSGGYGFGYP